MNTKQLICTKWPVPFLKYKELPKKNMKILFDKYVVETQKVIKDFKVKH